MTLAWDASTDPTVIAYNVYMGVLSRTYTNATYTTNTFITISNLQENITYFFSVTSIDLIGLESDYSAEIMYSVPSTTITNFNISLMVFPDGSVSLSSTVTPFTTIRIEYSDDGFKTWHRLDTVATGPSGALQVIDNTTNKPVVRFYRAFSL